MHKNQLEFTTVYDGGLEWHHEGAGENKETEGHSRENIVMIKAGRLGFSPLNLSKWRDAK
jgi:hypothetical protein